MRAALANSHLGRHPAPRPDGRHQPSIGSQYFEWSAVLLIFVVALVVFNRTQFFSAFEVLAGDVGDARLVSFLHEHVWNG